MNTHIATLRTRTMYASAVANFLAIWQNWVRKTPRLTLQENFISNQSYVDIVFSCHSAVNLIVFMRDNFPSTPCYLAEAGTDCCETTFSALGQWVGNHHNYTLLDMLRNTSHQVRLEQIRADPNGPKFSKPHPKGESIWHLLKKLICHSTQKTAMKFWLGEKVFFINPFCIWHTLYTCLLYTSPSPRDGLLSRMPSSA